MTKVEYIFVFGLTHAAHVKVILAERRLVSSDPHRSYFCTVRSLNVSLNKMRTLGKWMQNQINVIHMAPQSR